MASEAKLLVVQFLRWLDDRPRSQADVQRTWQSTCPLNCAWEDALADDLVAFGADGFIVLTPAGRAALQSAAPSGMPHRRALP
jgi:hypothetical protein